MSKNAPAPTTALSWHRAAVGYVTACGMWHVKRVAVRGALVASDLRTSPPVRSTFPTLRDAKHWCQRRMNGEGMR